MEKWKKIIGFEDLYEISSLGRIRSSQGLKKQILLPGIKNGYLYIFLYKNGEKTFFLINRLVAGNFIKNPNNKPVVNHKNGVKTDNRVENLEWATYQENTIHSIKTGLSRTKLTLKEVEEIRNTPYESCSLKELAEKYGVTKNYIWRIRVGNRRS